ncbi:MAG: hypothetical protein RLP09_30140 [Sandaracinaceae bacterium]
MRLVSLFGDSRKRAELLSSYLKFHSELRKVIKEDSWQWIGGSLLELYREPKDIDVVVWITAADARRLPPALSSPPTLKSERGLHVFYERLDVSAQRLQRRTGYWYELWTSRRGGGRKGFLELDSGADASKALKSLKAPS